MASITELKCGEYNLAVETFSLLELQRSADLASVVIG